MTEPVLILARGGDSDEGTFGELWHGRDRLAVSAEPPWRDNARARSCIPAGEYRATWSRSPTFGPVYRLHDVPGRSHILIHAGNYAGDPEAGLRTHTQGCILLGSRLGVLGAQRAVLASRQAVTLLAHRLNHQPFRLIITEANHGHS